MAARGKGHDMLSRTIGANVRRYRLQRGLTQQELAFRAGLCIKTIYRVEKGIANLTIDVAESIARVLDVPVLWLFA